jgi:hypothetical protein
VGSWRTTSPHQAAACAPAQGGGVAGGRGGTGGTGGRDGWVGWWEKGVRRGEGAGTPWVTGLYWGVNTPPEASCPGSSVLAACMPCLMPPPLTHQWLPRRACCSSFPPLPCAYSPNHTSHNPSPLCPRVQACNGKVRAAGTGAPPLWPLLSAGPAIRHVNRGRPCAVQQGVPVVASRTSSPT